MALQTNFTANATKLLVHPGRLHDWQRHHDMKPITLLISPTNKCNLHCEFCFTDSRDKTLELNLGEAITCTQRYIDKGILGVEITGGGEPTMWPHLQDYVNFCASQGMAVGLVTNGRKIAKGEVNENLIYQCKWMRVSCNSFEHEFRGFGEVPAFPLPQYFSAYDGDQVFSFSYIWTSDSDDRSVEYLKALLKANPKARALKIQQDTTNPVPLPEKFDEKVFFVTKPVAPHEQCYMHLIKPQLLADGKVYRCSCLSNIRPDMAIETWWGQAIENDGFKTSDCAYCTFVDYNKIMDMLRCGILHDSFV